MLENKRAQIKRYFLPFPQGSLWLLGGGLLFIVFFGPFYAYGLGLVGLAVGGWSIYCWNQRPSDATMDQWLQEDLQPLYERALQRSSLLDSECVRDPMRFHAPVKPREIPPDCFRDHTLGRDQRIRYSPVLVVIINFTKDQLAIYSSVLDLTTGNHIRESASEYFYKDVVAVSMESRVEIYTEEEAQVLLRRHPNLQKHLVNKTLQLQGAEYFVLSTKAGEARSVPLKDPSVLTTLNSGDFATNEAEMAAQAIRTMLRDTR